jgi:hypothetical protein
MHLKEQIAQRNAKKKKEKEMLEKLELLEEKRY